MALQSIKGLAKELCWASSRLYRGVQGLQCFCQGNWANRRLHESEEMSESLLGASMRVTERKLSGQTSLQYIIGSWVA